MAATREALGRLGLPGQDPAELPASATRFPDQGQWRVEIPSVEGPLAFRAALEEAAPDEARYPWRVVDLLVVVVTAGLRFLLFLPAARTGARRHRR